MRTFTCPTCRQRVKSTQPADEAHYPFCSHRCQMVDLGKWFDEQYRVSRQMFEEDDNDMPDEQR